VKRPRRAKADDTAEIRLHRLSRAYAMLASTNEAILRLDDTDSLFSAICRIAVEDGGYLGAWIGLRATPSGPVEITASAGLLSREDMVQQRISTDPSHVEGRGPTGMALRSGRPYYCGDFSNDPATVAWHQFAREHAIRSSATVPFRRSGTTVGAFTIFASETDVFDEPIRSVLEKMGDDVSFILDWTEGNAARQRAEETVRRLNDELGHTVLQRTMELEGARAGVEALAQSEQHFRLAFEDNMAPMIFTDLEDELIAVNDAFCSMLGHTREELVGHHSKEFTYPEDVFITQEAHARLISGEARQSRYVKRYLHQDGRVIIVEVSKSPARDAAGTTLYFVVSQRDITEERALHAQLSHQALHDPLTGLANRALFEDRLYQAHERVVRHGGLGAVLLLDLDDFKGVNDTHGHLVGDQLLATVARRLEQVTRSSDSLCRFGGDEFLYLAEGLISPSEVEALAARLLDALVEPFFIAGSSLEQHASIGVVVWDGSSTDSTELIQDADVALYEAKRRGKGHHVVFTPNMHQEAVGHFALLQELRHALAAGELVMHYQPIVDLATKEVVGFEALMRWPHPERGWVPPSVFIPLAEPSDLILEIGSFALREAVRAASSWERTGAGANPYVTVNLSAHQFHEPGLLRMIDQTLAQYKLAPERLIIEITETVALFDIAETLNVIEHLSRLGIGIALDDFGTGFSSLSHLVLLHPKIIKIDRSFVSPSQRSAYNDTLLETIISLGKKLNVIMLAEGIETQGQLEQLRHLGCELGQGYFFSPAVAASEVMVVVDAVIGR